MFGFLKRKKSPLDVPSSGAEAERYKGKPLLILLENYVLDCIGELPPGKDEQLRQAVQRVFGGGNDWKLTLRTQLQLGEQLDEHLREMWSRNQGIARQNNITLQPEQFAKMISDTNFAHLIERRN